MGNFSKPPLDQLNDALTKGYVSAHVEQGVPLLDRDLNLLADLIASRLDRIATSYIGDGFAEGAGGFAIEPLQPPSNDFLITVESGAGTCLVGGYEVKLTGTRKYASQLGAPPLNPPPPPSPNEAPMPRFDTVYLDAWMVEVTGDDDVSLKNPTDVGMQTSVRMKPVWMVRVNEGQKVPPSFVEEGHHYFPLAILARPRGEAQIKKEDITDVRQRRLTLASAVKRVTELEKRSGTVPNNVESRLAAIEAFLAPAFGSSPQLTPTTNSNAASRYEWPFDVKLKGRFNVPGVLKVTFVDVQSGERFEATSLVVLADGLKVTIDASGDAETTRTLRVEVTNGFKTAVSTDTFSGGNPFN